MSEYTKIELVAKGKTKEVWKTNMAGKVILKNLTDSTAANDPEKTKKFEDKAKYATTTTVRVFEFLEKSGIPTAYIEQFSETEIIVKSCRMIPLEVIVRRYAAGSYLTSHPELKTTENDSPHRFTNLCFEHRYTTPAGSVDSEKTLPANVEMKQIEELARKSFLVIEGAWNNIGYRLIDFKLEFGITEDGTLVVADVTDNDSWQLHADNRIVREEAPLSEEADHYRIVSQLVSLFRLPEQALVLWRGSESDKLPNIPHLAGLKVETPVISGHKKTILVTKELERLHTVYPEGGVIIALVGMSNGLGPILSARTSWPVISVCTTANEFPNDVWSALRMPSNVPNATMLDAKNAVLCALNILGQKNPAIYASRRLTIEMLDV